VPEQSRAEEKEEENLGKGKEGLWEGRELVHVEVQCVELFCHL